MGTLVNIVAFTGNGGVTNNSSSTYTGDIGADIGTISGFGSPTTVNGNIHNVDAYTQQAKIDLLNVYIHLNNIAVTNTTHIAAFGGETISPGVYLLGGAGSLTGAITLDGGGNTNAIFIIKFQGAFTVAVASSVTLINGTSAANVFWIAEGAISIGSGTTMKGTLISHPGAISFGAGGNLDGRMLATEGAIFFGHGIAAVPTSASTVGIVCNTTCINPTMGTEASKYALFSITGAVTNASSSSGFIGDIGSNSGSVSGFDTSISVVVGTVHNMPDASTAQAALDLQNAYNSLMALPVTNSSHPAAFGLGETITPGVYSIASAGSLAGNLILDGGGSSNALFVIRFGAAFTAAKQSNVILINGAQRCNIFWIAEGAIDLGAFTFMKGNFIAHGGANNMEANGNLEGRLFSTTGAVGFSTGVVYITYTLCSVGVLPVNWLYFRGKSNQKNVLLEWATSNEINNDFFTLEKSKDGVQFETLTRVNANVSTSNTEKQYSFTDEQPYTLGYYRLSQTDINGRRNYFNIIRVNRNTNQGINVAQYVLGNYINLKISGSISGNGFIELYSIEGKRIYSQQIKFTNEESNFKIEKPLQKGLYILHIKKSSGESYNGKVMAF